MRIATTQYQSTMNRSLQLNQEHIALLTQQMASGQRVQVPSDDPISAVRLSRLNREEAIVTQYRDNIASVQTRLTKNENFLTSMVSDMHQSADLLVWASDGGNASADLGAMVNSMAALRDSLFYSANLKDEEGRYIFAGTATGSAALHYDATAALGSRYSYTGNTGEQKVVVGNGVTQTANVDVQGLESLLNLMDNTVATLTVSGLSANDPAVRAVLTANLDGVTAGMEQFSNKIAVFGGAQNILGTLDTNHGNVSLSNRMALSAIGQVDYGLAATDLNGYTLALQATYKAYAKIGNLSLFDVL
ncbi:MAG: flagellar hook-associated protein FlgL [Pseudomonadota bacterium]